MKKRLEVEAEGFQADPEDLPIHKWKVGDATWCLNRWDGSYREDGDPIDYDYDPSLDPEDRACYAHSGPVEREMYKLCVENLALRGVIAQRIEDILPQLQYANARPSLKSLIEDLRTPEKDLSEVKDESS